MVVRKKGIDSGLREMGVRFRNFLGVICWYPNKSHWGLCWKFYPVTLISVRNLNTEILSFNFVTCFYPICLIQYVVGTQAMASPIVLLRLWYKAVFRWIWKVLFSILFSHSQVSGFSEKCYDGWRPSTETDGSVPKKTTDFFIWLVHYYKRIYSFEKWLCYPGNPAVVQGLSVLGGAHEKRCL